MIEFGRWFDFDNAPPGAYACVWAPEGKMQGASLAWMPLHRNQVPPEARRGKVLPLPNIPVDAKAS